MPGAADLVSVDSGRKWGVVTSGSRLLATNRLRYCGLPVPEVSLHPTTSHMGSRIQSRI